MEGWIFKFDYQRFGWHWSDLEYLRFIYSKTKRKCLKRTSGKSETLACPVRKTMGSRFDSTSKSDRKSVSGSSKNQRSQSSGRKCLRHVPRALQKRVDGFKQFASDSNFAGTS